MEKNESLIRNVVLLLLVFSIASIFYVGFLRSAWMTHARAANTLSSAKTLLSSIRYYAGHAPEYALFQASVKQQQEQLDQQLPRTADISQLMKQLSGYASEENVVIEQLEFLPEHRAKNLQRIPVRMVIKGGYSNIYNTIRKLVAAGRILRVNAFSISNANSSGGTSDLIGHFELSAYYMPE